ncbi:dethiobiotin synthase [Mergibacter septicus]|uniref:dethiobiotin synthase n=1 Tax=Mergibacter septicus TaxID=221402 RepID=UPI00117969B4|nr:dethiobiotin synthase [Mergibacter septicus]AWX13347.1 dethiobiotin synthase [Mergibacter septicus]
MSSFFVTGTDTNVGKTIVSRAIIQALQSQGIKIVGYKPIACGDEDSSYPTLPQEGDYTNYDNPDVKVLLDSTEQAVTYQEINSYTFTQSSTPVLAALNAVQNINIEKIDNNLSTLNQKYQAVLVEGTYGWLTPMNEEINFAKWVQCHQMPVILVVGIKEGCINHALLTAQSILAMGLPLVGWVANRVNPCLRNYAEIIELLKKEIEAPLLGEIPYVHRPEKQQLGNYLNSSEAFSIIQKMIK